ncbi:MAG: hypothetical protein ABW043_11400, partial [Devosia sp.]|uniref:hypothetical protein n=1 Tax=Devosia sp. TaxID=1871048 RepID=UPI00339A56AC
LSSDLDCDRLDYLRRTALHAGLPYGGVDVNYLVDNITLDDEETPCVRAKAVGPADHFLMSRSYDYAQLPFDKAVVGFEEALKIVLTSMHKDGALDLRRATLVEKIANREWQYFDDQRLYERMREYKASISENSEKANVLLYLRCIFERRAPKLVYSSEYISGEEKSHADEFSNKITSVREVAQKVFSEFGLPDERWFIWDTTFRLMKGKESGQRIRVERDSDGKRVGVDIDEDLGTLTSKFHAAVKRHIRVYACLIDEVEPKILRDKMRARIDSELQP